MTDDIRDLADTIVVRCPHCDYEFETHDVGDVCGCTECGELFKRFLNVVEEA